ncbi:hypothetical protein CR195_027810 (plasmid) [Bacillus cereus]|nr:hypothetical protein CR195_027810 [Bacillus cereus]
MVAVKDISHTRRYFEENGLLIVEMNSGVPFVPGASALGIAIVFRCSREKQKIHVKMKQG